MPWSNRTDRDFKFKVSYFEVYNEEINDLLQRGPQGRNLKVLRDDPRKGAIIEGLSERAVTCVVDVATGAVARMLHDVLGVGRQ